MSDGGGVGRIFLSRPLLKKWAIPGLFSFLFAFSAPLSENTLIVKFDDDWIQNWPRSLLQKWAIPGLFFIVKFP